jgi:hypothetical protein
MNDREDGPGRSDEEPGADHLPDEAREAGLMREVLRAQEQHREGGVDPELDETSGDREPEA